MNKDILKGRWNQLVGGLKQKWDDLTDDDWKQIGADKDKLIGRIQERYGLEKDEATRQVNQQFDDMQSKDRKVS